MNHGCGRGDDDAVGCVTWHFFYVIIQDTIYHIETLSSELSGLRWSGTLSRKKKLRLK